MKFKFSPGQTRSKTLVNFCACAVVLTIVIPGFVWAQRGLPEGRRVERLPRGVIEFNAVRVNRPSQGSDDEMEMGAALKTDPRLEQTLEMAERYRDDGNYRIATQLWQAVLQQSGDSLASTDGQTYFSLVDQVEQIIAALPDEGLQAYRITADASAREIMAQSGELSRSTALNQVVHQYFLSSLGDDAAFELGCLYLDKYDFIGARRMFEKIVNRYPDPSVSLAEVFVRIALCQSYLGEPTIAESSLAMASEVDRDAIYSQVQMVRESLGNINPGNGQTIVDSSWTCWLGNSKRDGVMPDVPDEMMESDLVAKWQFYFEPKKRYSKFEDARGNVLEGEKSHDDVALNTMTTEEKSLVKKWYEKNWRPAGHLLIDSGNIYYKSAADMTAWNASEIAEYAMNEEDDPVSKPLWRSMFRNSFMMDDASRQMQAIRQHYSNYGRRRGVTFETDSPILDQEIQIFGDTIFQQASIHNGVLYSIEGKRYDDASSSDSKRMSAQWNIVFRRTRSNYLTAYESDSGRTLWTLPRKPSDVVDPDREEPEWLESGGFMSSPIGFGDLILVPVNQSGSISIYALDPRQQGKTVWKAFLCDEPESGSRPWPPINLSIDGSDLFVSCGVGVVFILDPSTGLVRFAKRYERTGAVDNSFRQLNWSNPRTIFEGWSTDVIIPYGRQMICFCSDTRTINSYDRNTGALIWGGPNNPKEFDVDYLLGIYEGVLYAAGRETVLAIDAAGQGRMLWGGNQMFDGKKSYGRGMLTPGGIYIPVDDSIWKFDLNGNRNGPTIEAKAKVSLGTGAPVGNLYSDGTRIWVHGGNRVYGLWPQPETAINEDKESKSK